MEVIYINNKPNHLTNAKGMEFINSFIIGDIYTVINSKEIKGVLCYCISEVPGTWVQASRFMKKEEETAVLVTFTKIIEIYPIHAN